MTQWFKPNETELKRIISLPYSDGSGVLGRVYYDDKNYYQIDLSDYSVFSWPRG